MSSWVKLTSALATAALLVSAKPVVSEKRQLGECSREGLVGKKEKEGKADKIADTTEHCGQWDVVTYNQYSLLLDQWGKDNAESGQTCASITSANDDTIAVSRRATW